MTRDISPPEAIRVSGLAGSSDGLNMNCTSSEPPGPGSPWRRTTSTSKAPVSSRSSSCPATSTSSLPAALFLDAEISAALPTRPAVNDAIFPSRSAALWTADRSSSSLAAATRARSNASSNEKNLLASARRSLNLDSTSSSVPWPSSRSLR